MMSWHRNKKMNTRGKGGTKSAKKKKKRRPCIVVAPLGACLWAAGREEERTRPVEEKIYRPVPTLQQERRNMYHDSIVFTVPFSRGGKNILPSRPVEEKQNARPVPSRRGGKLFTVPSRRGKNIPSRPVEEKNNYRPVPPRKKNITVPSRRRKKYLPSPTVEKICPVGILPSRSVEKLCTRCPVPPIMYVFILPSRFSPPNKLNLSRPVPPRFLFNVISLGN